MKAKLFNIEAGKMISIMHEVDAKELGVLALDRIELFNPLNGKKIVTVADLTDSMVKEEEIGIFEDVRRELKAKKSTKLEVRAVSKPESVEFILKKLEGKTLKAEEMKAIVDDIGKNRLSEIETSAFMTAVYIHGFTLSETVSMTKSLIEDGKSIDFGKKVVLDKHSIGGVNGRSTMLVVPIIAAAGYLIPKTSSRSITSSTGTADAMEVLARVDLSLEEIKKIVKDIGGVITWGGALDLAPVDDKIIKIEHPLGLDPRGQVIASVMAKKASVGAKYLVIDIPVGPNMKVRNKKDAEEMAETFIEVGKRLGIKVEAMLTDGSIPNGKAFGPALEAKYVLETLEGKIFDNLAEKGCALAGALFELVGDTGKGEGRKRAEEILKSGAALKKMHEIIRAQQGKIFSSKQIKLSKMKARVNASNSGVISEISVHLLNRIARTAGAPADKKAGLLLKADKGQKIKKGQCLFEIYAENPRKLGLAKKMAKANQAIELERIILEEIA